MRPRRLRSADAETVRTNRGAEGRCQEGARCSCRGAEAQECRSRCSTSRQSTASVDHREQQLHRRPLGHRTSGRLTGRRSPSRATNQACKGYCGGIVGCSSSRLWYRPAASGPFPPQLSHPNHTGAVEPTTAAAPAAPDVASPAELPLQVGRKRRACSSPNVRLKLLARKGYCARHACADAQGCDSGSDCTALPCAAVRFFGTYLYRSKLP